MNRKTIGILIVFLTIALISWSLWSIYYILPVAEAKPQIQAFLDKNYTHKFTIEAIEKDYCPDLFHQPWGYTITLKDTNNVVFGNMNIQFNKYQKAWITYGGTDIDKAYEIAKGH